jgi:hypothetical protein
VRRRAGPERPGSLPLWLTQHEAETLLHLCAASPAAGGKAEETVFTKLGELLRRFWRSHGPPDGVAGAGGSATRTCRPERSEQV